MSGLGMGLDLGLGARGSGVSPYATYALALPFKTGGPYWVNGTSYATLGALPGYTFTDIVDNLPNLSASGYSSLVAELSNLQATVNPITSNVDFIWWAVADIPAPNVNYHIAATMGGPAYLFWTPGNTYGFADGAGEFTDAGLGAYVAGRNVIMGRRRSGKTTLAIKKPDTTVIVGTESAVRAWPATTSAFYMGVFNNGALQVNGPIELIALRTGVFSDGDMTTLLTAA